MKRRTLWSAAALLALGAVGVFLLLDRGPYHFKTVREGVLYRSGTLDANDLRSVIQQYGIKTVVNLRHDPEAWASAEEKRITQQLGARFEDLPLQRETPPNDEELAVWLRLLDDPSRLPILVHCEHGVTRTGMFVGVYQMEKEHLDNRKVLEDLEFFGHRKWAEHRKPFRDFILQYKPRWKTEAVRSSAQVGGAASR